MIDSLKYSVRAFIILLIGAIAGNCINYFLFNYEFVFTIEYQTYQLIILVVLLCAFCIIGYKPKVKR